MVKINLIKIYFSHSFIFFSKLYSIKLYLLLCKVIYITSFTNFFNFCLSIKTIFKLFVWGYYWTSSVIMYFDSIDSQSKILKIKNQSSTW